MTDPPEPNFSRRDFLIGAGSGLSLSVAGARGLWLAAPVDWHAAQLTFGTQLSYAQCGEDLLLDSLFARIGIRHPTYLDIGAYDPIIGSNSYRFYRNGARGVLVEPNVSLTEKLRRVRPGDVVLPIGIGIDDTEQADYYVLNYPQRNTFDKAAADEVERQSGGQVRIERVVKMPLVNVNRVIAEHFGGKAPDLFSIDVEGLDVAILKTLDFERYRPAVVCAEHPGDLEARSALHAMMAERGYTLRAMNLPNSMFVDDRRMA